MESTTTSTSTSTSFKNGDYRDEYIKNMTPEQLTEWKLRELTRKNLSDKYNTEINMLDSAIDIIKPPINEKLTGEIWRLCRSYKNKIRKVKKLFKQALENDERIDVDYKGEKDTTVTLVSENYAGKTALMMVSENGHVEIVKLLLKHGANPNPLNQFDETALMWASIIGHFETVELLLKHGADINIKTDFYDTALVEASRCGRLEVVKLLLDHKTLNLEKTNSV